MSNRDFLTATEAAAALHVHPTTIQTWCRQGKLPAERCGRAYRIPRTAFEAWIKQWTSQPTIVTGDAEVPSELSELAQAWRMDLEKGVKPCSPETVRTHWTHFIRYVKLLSGESPEATFTYQQAASARALEAALMRIPVTKFATRYNIYFAVVSFTKFLVRRGLAPEQARTEMKALKPKRLIPERRTFMHSAEELNRFFDTLWLSEGHTKYEKLMNAAMIGAMAFAGLRVSEVASLELNHLDLSSHMLVVQRGKGGKTRMVGVNTRFKKLLVEYLSVRQACTSARLFVSADGKPLNRDYITRRIRRLAKRSGIDVTCHGLRRTFATLNADAGRSLNLIQLALGHSSLETTQKYLMADQRTAARAMTDW